VRRAAAFAESWCAHEPPEEGPTGRPCQAGHNEEVIPSTPAIAGVVAFEETAAFAGEIDQVAGEENCRKGLALERDCRKGLAGEEGCGS
jgi:hypothetical protein